MMLTIEEYVGVHQDSPDWTQERQDNAARLCVAVNDLAAEMQALGVNFRINPTTGSVVSGQTYGGFRPQDCIQGAPNSSHKKGLAVDLYDPGGDIDCWLMKHVDKLEEYGIYIEHPDDTPHWSHWTIQPPGSGRHVFKP